MYDPQIGRWHTPDPLQEDEYWSEFDKEYKAALEEEGYEAGEEEIESGRKNAGILTFLSPRSAITAENSAIHYNESPYAYVGNNPINFIDPFGLDTAKGKVLQNVTVKAVIKHTAGPVLILAGQPFNYFKPVGAMGSQPGSSLASWWLAKKMPGSTAPLKIAVRKKLTKVVGEKTARKIVNRAMGATVKGRLLGRLVPGLGWVLLGKDVVDNWDAISEIGNDFAKDFIKMQRNPETFVCFQAGTLVYSKTEFMLIENIKIGDTVYSYNIEKDIVELNKVVNTFTRTIQSIYEITAGKETINVTAEHPFYVVGKGWIKTKDLQVGYVLKSPDNKTTVKISTVKELNKAVTVYNIEVDGNHNYFVTGSTILVHNKNITGIKVEQESEDNKTKSNE